MLHNLDTLRGFVSIAAEQAVGFGDVVPDSFRLSNPSSRFQFNGGHAAKVALVIASELRVAAVNKLDSRCVEHLARDLHESTAIPIMCGDLLLLFLLFGAAYRWAREDVSEAHCNNSASNQAADCSSKNLVLGWAGVGIGHGESYVDILVDDERNNGKIF